MAPTTLTSAAASQWLAGAASRLTAIATRVANRGPHTRDHGADSPTVTGRLGPKSMEFSAPSLDLASRKTSLHLDRKEAPRLLERLHVSCWDNSWEDSQEVGRVPGGFLFIFMERRSHILELAPDPTMGARECTHRYIEEWKKATYSRPESVAYAFLRKRATCAAVHMSRDLAWVCIKSKKVFPAPWSITMTAKITSAGVRRTCGIARRQPSNGASAACGGVEGGRQAAGAAQGKRLCPADLRRRETRMAKAARAARGAIGGHLPALRIARQSRSRSTQL
jgi:hypothetical protein